MLLSPLTGRYRFVITADHHGPVSALAARILSARNPYAGRIVQQQVLAVAGRADPLAERLLETIMAIGNILGGTPRSRRWIRLVNGPSVS
jgi:hypothetical protein